MAKTSATIATQSTDTGYEHWTGGIWPYQRAFVASNGAAIVVYLYRLGADLVWAYRYSNVTRTSWSSHQVIYTVAPGIFNNGYDQCSACMDSSGNIHVAIEYYLSGVSRTEIYYVKLTRSGATWSTGSVINVFQGSFDGAGRTRGLGMSFDGTYRFIACYNNDSSGGGVFYSSSGGGGTWTWAPLIASTVSYSYPVQVNSANGLTIFLAVTGGATLKIQARVGTGTSFASVVDLWTGGSLVVDGHDNAYYGMWALYLGHATVDWIVIARLEDGSQRLKKYKNGWIAGEVVLKASGATLRETHAVWDAAGGMVYIWWSNTQPPQSYNPANDAVSSTGLDVSTTQIFPASFDAIMIGEYSGFGSAGTATLTWYEDTIGELFPFQVPDNARAIMNFDTLPPAFAFAGVRLDSYLASFGLPFGFFMAEADIPEFARANLALDTNIPHLLIPSNFEGTFNYAIATAALAEMEFSQLIPALANYDERWIHEQSLDDLWTREIPVTDTWVKESSVSDLWSKE